MEREEAGAAASDRERGTEKRAKKVGQRQTDQGQRLREMPGETAGRQRYPDTKGEVRTETERRGGEAGLRGDRRKVGQGQCDRER